MNYGFIRKSSDECWHKELMTPVKAERFKGDRSEQLELVEEEK